MLLTQENYTEIKIAIADIYEDYGEKTLPIDIKGLAAKMNLDIIYFSDIRWELNESELEDLKDIESLLYFDKVTGQYKIYVDDCHYVDERVRFSIAHEIGHFVLQHSFQSDANEEAANYFAHYLLAPTPVLACLDDEFVETEESRNMFGVSKMSYQIGLFYREKRLGIDLDFQEYERRIFNNFLDFIRAKEDDEPLPF